MVVEPGRHVTFRRRYYTTHAVQQFLNFRMCTLRLIALGIFSIVVMFYNCNVVALSDTF